MKDYIKEAVKQRLFPIKINTIKTERHLRSEVRILLAGKEFASYMTTNPEDIRSTVKFIRTQVAKAREKQQEMFDEDFKSAHKIRAAYLLIKLKMLTA